MKEKSYLGQEVRRRNIVVDGKSESTGCADQRYLEIRGLLDWGGRGDKGRERFF